MEPTTPTNGAPEPTRSRSYALADLPWTEVRSALERDARLIFPVGALEQHGPHLPLGTNATIAARVAEEVSRRCGILRAPPFSYGVSVGGGPYCGSAGLRRKTLHRAVNELFAHWEDRGVDDFVIVTAHRHEAHLEPLLMALTRNASKSVYDLYEIDVSDILEGDPETEHGGELETSLMLHLTPELVRTEEIEDSAPYQGTLRRYIRRRVPKGPSSGSGVVGWPSRATADKGRAVFERYVETLSAGLPPHGTPEP